MLPSTRPPLARMARIHARLREGARVTCNGIAAELETSRKTIWRDLEFMRDQLNLPVEYDRQGHTFTYAQPVDGALFGALAGRGAAC